MDVYYKVIKCRNNAYILENQYTLAAFPVGPQMGPSCVGNWGQVGLPTGALSFLAFDSTRAPFGLAQTGHRMGKNGPQAVPTRHPVGLMAGLRMVPDWAVKKNGCAFWAYVH